MRTTHASSRMELLEHFSFAWRLDLLEHQTVHTLRYVVFTVEVDGDK